MKKKGRGVSCCIYSATVPSSPNPCAANVQMREDGSVVIQTGATDIGQGSNTAIAAIAAEELGIEIDKVTVYSGDTGLTPFDFGTFSSRLTFVGGNAVREACKEVKATLIDSASKQLQVPAEKLTIVPGFIQSVDNPEVKLPIAAAGLSVFAFRRLPIGTGYYYPKNTPIDEFSQGSPFATFSYAGAIAEVEVDTDTGVVEVLEIHAAADCGKAINPTLVEGQIQGGTVMGIGFALREEGYPYMDNIDGLHKDFSSARRPDNLSDYAIATAIDTPDIHTYIIEDNDCDGPYGAKSVGEITLNPAAPAIINAIYDAVGVRIHELPARPDRILKALREKKMEGRGA